MTRRTNEFHTEHCRGLLNGMRVSCFLGNFLVMPESLGCVSVEPFLELIYLNFFGCVYEISFPQIEYICIINCHYFFQIQSSDWKLRQTEACRSHWSPLGRLEKLPTTKRVCFGCSSLNSGLPSGLKTSVILFSFSLSFPHGTTTEVPDEGILWFHYEHRESLLYKIELVN